MNCAVNECGGNLTVFRFGESESAVESCVESCGSFTLVNFLLAFLQDFVNFKSFLIKKGRKNRLKEGSRR